MSSYYLQAINAHSDIDAFYKLIMNNTDYFTDYKQTKPSLNDIKEELLIDVPPGVGLNKKEVYGIYKENELIGFVDLLFNYPSEDNCMLGYLVIDQKYRNQGIGQKVYDDVEKYIKSKFIKKIRLGVIAENKAALKIWKKQGFTEIEKIDTEYGHQITMEHII